MSFSLPPPRERSSVTLRRGTAPFFHAAKPEPATSWPLTWRCRRQQEKKGGGAGEYAASPFPASPSSLNTSPMAPAFSARHAVLVFVEHSLFRAQGFAPSRSTRSVSSLAHDRVDARVSHPATTLRHGSFRPCDRYRLRLSFKPAFSQAATLAFEAQPPSDSATPDRLHRPLLDLHLIERFRRRSRALPRNCPVRTCRPDDPSVHGHSPPVPYI